MVEAHQRVGPNRSAWYRNSPLVVGLVLLALGLGNWITGTIRMQEYQERIDLSRIAPSQGGLSPSAPSAVETEIALGRLDFYHVIASGGRLMAASGFLLVTFGLARGLRPLARREGG